MTNISSAKNVLMLVHTFPPYGTVGGSIRIVKFLKYLNRGENGWRPTVVTLRNDLDYVFTGRNSEFSLQEISADQKIIRSKTLEPHLPSIKHKGFEKLYRLMLLTLFKPLYRYFLIPDGAVLSSKPMVKTALQELGDHKYSVIYATAPPFSVLLSARRLKEQTGLPLIFDIKDDWIAEERFRGLKRTRLACEKKMEASCIAAADKVITVTPQSHEAYVNSYPEQSDKFELIPNGCDLEEYKPYWQAPLEKFNKFTFIHTGVFSKRRDLRPFFQAIKNVCQSGFTPEITSELDFIVLGRVPAEQKKAIHDLGLEKIIRQLDYLPREEYVQTLCRAHLPVAINYEIPSLVPGKIYEYWGARNPMLLLDSDESAAANLVKENSLGFVADPKNIKGIEQILLSCFKQWHAGKTTFLSVENLKQFDRKHLTRRLESVLASVAR